MKITFTTHEPSGTVRRSLTITMKEVTDNPWSKGEVACRVIEKEGRITNNCDFETYEQADQFIALRITTLIKNRKRGS